MRASARLAVARDSDDTRTRITCLRSEAPFILRPANVTVPASLSGWTGGCSGEARVALAAGAAGPIGGDTLALSIDVDAGATLIFGSVAATIALPGPHGEASVSEADVRVAAGGTLVWLPGPMIAARGCDHRATTRVTLAPGARLLLREELLLGRHGEQPGTIRQRLRVRVGDRAIHDQELAVGAGVPGWDGPAVTGGRRALGTVLVVGAGSDRSCTGLPAPQTGEAVLALNSDALLIVALADNALDLRRRLDAAVARTCGPVRAGISVRAARC